MTKIYKKTIEFKNNTYIYIYVVDIKVVVAYMWSHSSITTDHQSNKAFKVHRSQKNILCNPQGHLVT